MNEVKMQVIDVFAGCGSAARGLTNAGMDHVLAIEWDPWAILSLNANLPQVPVSSRNLFLYSFAEICREHGICDFRGMVWLSPPCQSFSMAGKKRPEEDARSNLLFMANQAAELFPEAWIVVENVKGLTAKHSASFYDRLLDGLRAKRKVATWILDAQSFGLAQTRERLIVVAAPEGFPLLPEEPKGENAAPKGFAQALSEIQDVDPEFYPLSGDAELVLYSQIGDGENFRAGAYGRAYAALKGKENDDNFLKRVNSRQPVPCVMAAAPKGFQYRALGIHPTEQRYLSCGENRAVQGIPEDFLIAGPLEARIRQIGNAVPPILSKMVGLAIKEAIRMASKLP